MFFTKKEKEAINNKLTQLESELNANKEQTDKVERLIKDLFKLSTKINTSMAPYGFKRDGTPAKKRGRKSRRIK
jgi:hypothetical protein